MRRRSLIVAGGLVAFMVTPAMAGQLVLTFTDNATDESGFRVERCLVVAPATTCANYIQIAQITPLVDPPAGGIKQWVNTGLPVGNTYCYRVRAYNATGVSAYSNEACGTVPMASAPTAPDFLAVN